MIIINVKVLRKKRYNRKLIYVLEPDNITEDSKYWYLTKLAAKCSAKRLVPDYISEKKMIEFKGDCFPCMGCRSFLSPYKDPKTGQSKYYGRLTSNVKATLNDVNVYQNGVEMFCFC